LLTGRLAKKELKDLLNEGAVSDKEYNKLFKAIDSDKNNLIGMDGMQLLLSL
jgi:Ca2+-binding EF-hand superfamily protein